MRNSSALAVGQPGDVVIWDDRRTMHRGRWHDPGEVRDLRRTTVSDEVPTVDGEAKESEG